MLCNVTGSCDASPENSAYWLHAVETGYSAVYSFDCFRFGADVIFYGKSRQINAAELIIRNKTRNRTVQKCFQLAAHAVIINWYRKGDEFRLFHFFCDGSCIVFYNAAVDLLAGKAAAQKAIVLSFREIVSTVLPAVAAPCQKRLRALQNCSLVSGLSR